MQVIHEIEKQLNKDYQNIFDWFVDKKVSIDFSEDKTKSALFASKEKLKNVHQLNIRCKQTNIKQYSQVSYLGCVLDKTMLGEPMALKDINKINRKLKFLFMKNRYLTRVSQKSLQCSYSPTF